jgi:hypothetical protein
MDYCAASTTSATVHARSSLLTKKTGLTIRGIVYILSLEPLFLLLEIAA